MRLKKSLAKVIAVFMLTALCAMGFCSCSDGTLYSEGEGDVQVVCTVFPPFDLAREVGGELITLTLLQSNGTDLHNYTPTNATLDALRTADVFIYIGGVSDQNWIDKAIAASGNDNLISVCLMDYITPVHADLQNDWTDHSHSHDDHADSDGGHKHSGHSHTGDEHIWTSLKNAKLMVSAIESALSAADETNSRLYKQNAAQYTEKLNKLDAEYQKAALGATKPLVVIADRFPFVYLFHDYHIPYKAAFSGCSTEINSSFETQISLIKTVEKFSLGCIITIEGSDKTMAEAISNQTNCHIQALNSLQSVTASQIIEGITYLDIMTENLSVFKEAIGYD